MYAAMVDIKSAASAAANIRELVTLLTDQQFGQLILWNWYYKQPELMVSLAEDLSKAGFAVRLPE